MNVKKKVGRHDSTTRNNTTKGERFLHTQKALQEASFAFLGHDHTLFREGLNISGRFALHFFIFSYRCQRLSLHDVRTCDWTCVFIYKYTYAYIHMYESEH